MNDDSDSKEMEENYARIIRTINDCQKRIVNSIDDVYPVVAAMAMQVLINIIKKDFKVDEEQFSAFINSMEPVDSEFIGQDSEAVH